VEKMEFQNLKKTILSLLVLSLVAACNTVSPVINTSPEYNSMKGINKTASLYSITGKAEFPDSNKFSTKAAIDNVAKQSTVSIIRPSDYVTLATGLTDASGNFTINPDAGFNPAENEVFILEAVRRTSFTLQDLMSVRTYIQWKGTGWESITTPTIKIDAKTTALSVIASFNTGTINPANLINKINIVNGVSILQDINTEVTAQVITDTEVMVNAVLAENRDPFDFINKSGNSYVLRTPTPIVMPFTKEGVIYRIGDDFEGSIVKYYLSDLDGNRIDLTQTINMNNTAYHTLSEDRKRVYFVRNTSPEDRGIYSVDVNGQNLVKQIPDITVLDRSLNRTKFLYYNNKKIFISDRNLNNRVELTAGYTIGNLFGNYKSLDRQKSVFLDNGNGIYILDWTGVPSLVKVSNMPSSWSFESLTWSADSQRFLIVGNGTNGRTIFVINANGTFGQEIPINNITDEQIFNPRPVANGTKVVFQSGSYNGGISKSYIADSNGTTDLTTITATPGKHTYISSQGVSKDGTKVVMSVRTVTPACSFDWEAPPPNSTWDLYILDNLSGTPTAQKVVSDIVTPDYNFVDMCEPGNYGIYNYFAPNSAYFVFNKSFNSGEFYRMDSNGSNPVMISSNGTFAFYTDSGSKLFYRTGGNLWSANADGTGNANLNVGSGSSLWTSYDAYPNVTEPYLLYGPNGLYTVDRNSGNVTNLNLSGYDGGYPKWSPDGTKIITEGDELRLFNLTNNTSINLSNSPNTQEYGAQTKWGLFNP
jgi:hypothetical protein